MDPIIHFSGSFAKLIEDVKATNKLCVIDCFAVWCGPCKRLGEILPQIANENPDVAFFKVDAEQNMEIAQGFGVRAFPSIFFMIGENVVDSVVGANVQEIKEKISRLKEVAKETLVDPSKPVELTPKSDDGVIRPTRDNYQLLMKEVEMRNVPCAICFVGQMTESGQLLTSHLPSLAQEFADKAAIYEIDVQKLRKIRHSMNVLAIPETYIIKGTKTINSVLGNKLDKIKEIINSSL